MKLAHPIRVAPLPLLISLVLLVVGVLGSGQSADGAKPTTVYLVRHAEKQESPSNPDTETPLVAAGQARAKKLAELLAGCSISVAYTTPYKRTIDTAKPLVEQNHLLDSPVVTNPRDMASLLEQIRKLNGKNVLVVGHSNTVPAVARALAGREDAVPDIADQSHDDLFVVTVTRWEPREATVKRFRFGEKSPSRSPTFPDFTGCQE